MECAAKIDQLAAGARLAGTFAVLSTFVLQHAEVKQLYQMHTIDLPILTTAIPEQNSSAPGQVFHGWFHHNALHALFES